ncbi:metallopeptidase TldD-related protein [Nanoarchaeota archaeon]
MAENSRELIKELEKARKNKDITDWKIISHKINRVNVYVEKNFKIESELKSKRNDLEATVYKKVRNKLGESTFPVNDKKDIAKLIKDASVISKNSIKQEYSLPSEQKKIKNVKLADPFIIKAFKDKKITYLLEKIIDLIKKEFRKHKGVKLNGMEFHTSVNNIEIINSKKIKQNQAKTRMYIELTITSFKGKKENEFLPYITLNRLDDLNIKEFVKNNVETAKHILNSQPTKHYEGRIILNKDAVGEFFSPHLGLTPLVMHAAAKLKHMGLARFEKNEKISDYWKGEEITVSSNPFIPYNPASNMFDNDGVNSKKLKLIDKGIFVDYFASKQYADYLNIEPTGALGIIEIKPGKKLSKDLMKDEFIEIVSFSSFVPNAISGDFAAEIRLAYHHKNGLKTPIKGGMFTGNVFDLIKNAYYSKETKLVSGYKGPKVVSFEEGVIAGL